MHVSLCRRQLTMVSTSLGGIVRVIQFSEFGDPSRLQLVARPDLEAGASTAIIQVVAAGVNPSDIKNVAGRMTQTTLPRVPGRDCSAVVVNGPSEWLGSKSGEPAAIWESRVMAAVPS